MAQAPVVSHTFMDWPQGTVLPGIVVPQRVYNIGAPFQQLNTIRFTTNNGRLGYRLSDALSGTFAPLDNGNDPMIVSTAVNGRISIRMEWPGYPTWGRQVHAIDNQMQPFGRARLAQTVARAIEVFIAEHGHVISTELRPDWWLQNIPFERLYLVELRHVSAGSWQPYLCYAP